MIRGGQYLCLCLIVLATLASSGCTPEEARAIRIATNQFRTQARRKLLERHFPLPGRIVPGRMERLDRPLIPPDAMREILVNALIHGDYAHAGGAVSLAIFDDRVEVWSAGTLPSGITPEALSRPHRSILRNPLIAEVFNRAGLIEKWGRGTNRVIEQCREHGIAPPKFEEITGATVVTFRVEVGRTVQVTAHVAALLEAAEEPRSREELQNAVGLRHRMHFLKAYLEPLLKTGWLEMTVPDKPKSRLQRYRATAAGLAQLRARSAGAPKPSRSRR